MSRCQAVARPLARQLSRPQHHQLLVIRSLSTTSSRTADVQQQPPQEEQQQIDPAILDPDNVLPEHEAALARVGKSPIGSQRRRVAKHSTLGLPWEQLPFQAFQEARKVLAADREEKLAIIKETAGKIAWLEAKDPKEIQGGQDRKDLRLASLRKHIEQQKIFADVNDPAVKKRYEDGLGDMDKPIYRYFAEKKWRNYDHRVITQRIEQFHIVPDILPKFDPTADVQLYFRQQKVPPGQILDSSITEQPPRLRVQVFDRGERLVSIVVLDSDVPEPGTDGFSKRCHFLAANVPLSPTQPSLPLGRITGADQLAVPWLPAFSQKGAPYHRLSVFLLEQKPGEQLDVAKLKELYTSRDGFSLKSFRDKFGLTPFGFNIFRTVWDENTATVMGRHQLPGGDVEFRPRRVYSLKVPRKPRGWEAKHMGPKYLHLARYTKRIRGISNAKRWTKR